MSTEARALELLGQGTPPEMVASALGVSASRISQLLSEDEFAAAVAERKFKVLAKANSLDEKYNELEEDLVNRLKRISTSMVRPGELLKAIQVINAAKRRGVMAPPESGAPGNKPVTIVLPQVIKQKFITNVNNQILQVTDRNGQAKSLVTATSAGLNSLAKVRSSEKQSTSDNQETASAGSGESCFRQVAVTADDL